MKIFSMIKSMFVLDRKEIFVLGLIIILGLLLRFTFLLPDRFIFFLDAARDFILVDQIVTDHKLFLIGGRSGVQGIFHGPLWLYMLVPIALIAQGNPYLMSILTMVAYVSVSVVLSYVIAKHFYGRVVATLFALTLVTAQSIVTFSLMMTNAHMAPVVFIGFLFAGISFMRGNEKSLLVQALCVGLMVHFESAFAVFLPLLIVLQFLLAKRIARWKTLFMSCVVFTLSISSYIVFELRHSFLMTNTVLNIISGKIQPSPDSQHLQNIGVLISDRLSGFFYYFMRPFAWEHIILNIFSIGALLVGTSFVLRGRSHDSSGKNNKELIWIFSIPWIYYTVFLLYKQILWAHYSFALTTSASLLTAILVSRLFLLGKTQKILAATITIAIFLSVAIAIVQTIYSLRKLPSKDYLSQRDAAEYVLTDSKGEANYFVYDPGQLTYKMDYLIRYFARSKNVRIQNNKERYVYLFLYPPPTWNPGGAQWWKENIINTQGEVVAERNFNDVVIVQKIKVGTDEKPVKETYFQNVFFR